MARMSIDDKLLRDPRAIHLGQKYGWNRYEAVGRLTCVYAICYDREIDVLRAVDIDTAAEQPGLSDAMIEVGLAVAVRGGVRIKGAKERIKYLTAKAEAGKIGGVKSGESRRNRREAKRSTASQAHEASANPPDPVPDVVPDPAPVPDQIQIPDSPPARAIPPVPEPVAQQPTRVEVGSGAPADATALRSTPSAIRQRPLSAPPGPEAQPTMPPPTRLPVTWSGPPNHEAVAARTAIRKEVLAALEAARERVSKSLGKTYRPLPAFPAGESHLMRRILLAGDLTGIRDELVHVVEMAALEAEYKTKSLQWLTGMLFDLPHDGSENKNYRRFASGDADDYRRPEMPTKRAGPKPTVHPGLAAQLEKIARLEAEEAAERARQETA